MPDLKISQFIDGGQLQATDYLPVARGVANRKISGANVLSYIITSLALNFADNEVPSGTINGVNTVFTLVNSPSPSSSLKVYVNGQRLKPGIGNDFTISGLTITLTQPPIVGDVILCDYRY